MTRIIWGYDKDGVPRCYALAIPDDEVRSFMEKAKREGWTGLVTSVASASGNEQGEGRESEESG